MIPVCNNEVLTWVFKKQGSEIPEKKKQNKTKKNVYMIPQTYENSGLSAGLDLYQVWVFDRKVYDFSSCII